MYSQGWNGGEVYDPPMVGAIESLAKLLEEYNVFILTSRDPEQVLDFMSKHARELTCEIVPEDKKFWFKKGVIGVTNRKLPAIMYIDDRAVRFTTWDDVSKLLI